MPLPGYSRIGACVYYLPERIVDNAEIAAKFPEWDINKIASKTGITSRHIAAPDETALDLGARAIEKLFAVEPSLRDRVDFLVSCTQSPDFRLPPNSCLLQKRLGLPLSIGTVDLSHGCSGFIYALSVAHGLIAGGQAECILVVTAETYSTYLSPNDKSVQTIFGDAGAAVIVETSEISRLGPFVFGTDGGGAERLIVPQSGARSGAMKETWAMPPFVTAERGLKNLYMDGPEIFRFTLLTVPALLNSCLTKAGLTVEKVDHFIFHQANKFMLENLRVKCGIPEEKFIVDLADIGNTVSSTIPIALSRARDSCRVQAGDIFVMLGFGVGYSSAATVATA